MPAQRSADKVKRPPNAWILFRSDIARSIAQHEELHPDLPRKTQPQISQEISFLWNTLDPIRKAEYERRAAAKKYEHTLLYPDYRFQPVRKEEKERQKHLKKHKFKGKRYRQCNDTESSLSTPSNQPDSLVQSSQNTNSSEFDDSPPSISTTASPCNTTTLDANNKQALSLEPLALDPSATAPAQSHPSRFVASIAPTTQWTPADRNPVWNIPNYTPDSSQEVLEQTTPGHPNLRPDLQLPPQSSQPFDGKDEFERNLQAIANVSGNPFDFRVDNIDTEIFSAGNTGVEARMFSYPDLADGRDWPLSNNNPTAPIRDTPGYAFDLILSNFDPSLSSASEYETNLDQFVDWDGGGAAPKHSRENERTKFT
ncbi:hypothetical protein V5O48_018258 [Marasmius crinis-equi]|uniref:HMG box domain-containing protein n=1 Tax=Marasmius crinis-equi TaxID=585013 RepID=A0ABR3ELT5_9AGAR